MILSGQRRLARRILTGQWPKWNNIVGNISTTVSCADNSFYDALGVPKTSTQRDIKAAYYKLSMQYHPDKNQGSKTAVQKFREITKAYEVLSNYKLRRLYDKGVGITTLDVTDDIPRHDDVVPEDDNETKFYKSRFKKSTVTVEGRTPIYDFDEWSRAHYGKAFQRRQTAQMKYERKENAKKFSHENEFLLFGMLFFLFVTFMIFRQETKYDTPTEVTSNAKRNNDRDN